MRAAWSDAAILSTGCLFLFLALSGQTTTAGECPLLRVKRMSAIWG